MKFANLHDDIGNDLYDHRMTEPGRLDAFHYPRFKQGGMVFSAIVCCFNGQQDWKEMEETVRYAERAVLESSHFSFEDDRDVRVFLAVEGMCGITEEPEEKIRWLYEHHVRLGSLCWNDKNALACGAKSGNMPLTDLGIRAVREMNRVGMAVDASHCCEWNFYDLNRVSETPVIASHSNARALYNHYRNLSDPQLEAIRDRDGLVGAIPVRWFVKNKAQRATLEDFLQVILYLREHIGTERTALGFDFMDYMEGMEDSNVEGMRDITQIGAIARGLEDKGLGEAEVRAICHDNARRFMEAYL